MSYERRLAVAEYGAFALVGALAAFSGVSLWLALSFTLLAVLAALCRTERKLMDRAAVFAALDRYWRAQKREAAQYDG